MNPQLFLADLEAKPAALRELAGSLRDDGWAGVPAKPDRVVLLGMGSSRYAAQVVAARMRALGVNAVADYASAQALPPGNPQTLVVAVSATGTSRETVDAAGAYAGRAPLFALTNSAGSVLSEMADATVPMLAGEELGGVACRTFQHTLIVLLALANRLTGSDLDLVALTRTAADATEDLLARRGAWLPAALELLDGVDGLYAIAPAERLSSALQSALMVREGPRRPAAACETGDWAHVDVYLTKTLDYRALLFPGSRYDRQAMEWIEKRGSTVLGVGAQVPGAAGAVRYHGDDDPMVALLTETLVAELIAARWWLDASEPTPSAGW